MREACGIFGVFGPAGLNAASLIHRGLFALQHRGQESCGIAVNDRGQVRLLKDMGLVSEVIGDDDLHQLQGAAAIGHVRYATTGPGSRENAQPLLTRYSKGILALAHNGNLANTDALRHELEHKGAIFQTSIDSEIIAYLIARHRPDCATVEEAVSRSMRQLRGAYSLLIMSRGKLLAVRDPLGMRPLCLGRIGETVVFASESCALDAVDATFVRDLDPGEIVVADRSGVRSLRTHCGQVPRPCIFEYIYFARPDSCLDSVSVYQARLAAGRLLASQHPVAADLVIGVPDSGNDAALGYSQASGIPFGKGLVKNNYVGRTFIKPSQAQRISAVRIKLNPIRSSVSGKRLVLVDDSIVRGTTSARIVTMLKAAGAAEVHVRISSPPFLWPCYFGTDIPTSEELAAPHHTLEEIRQQIGADSLGFLDPASLAAMLGKPGATYCDACFSGRYPLLSGHVADDDTSDRYLVE
ncbi:MAG: amidophosphoribosyltransferase [Clostridiaceae bacterium]|nr:amidophosphoribosyltransferase [Clostridiaceae bacterium]